MVVVAHILVAGRRCGGGGGGHDDDVASVSASVANYNNDDGKDGRR